jgi:hypothetical protein
MDMFIRKLVLIWGINPWGQPWLATVWGGFGMLALAYGRDCSLTLFTAPERVNIVTLLDPIRHLV